MTILYLDLFPGTNRWYLYGHDVLKEIDYGYNGETVIGSTKEALQRIGKIENVFPVKMERTVTFREDDSIVKKKKAFLIL